MALLLLFESSVVGTLTADGVSALARITWIGYPVLDAVLIGLLAWRVVLDGRVRLTALMGLAGVVSWLVADLARLLLADPDVASGWQSGGWLVGIALLAGVPWTRPAPAEPSTTRRPAHSRWRMLLNTAPSAAPAVVEVIGWHRGVDVNPVPVLVVWAVLLVLASIRTRVLALDGERAWKAVRSQARRYEALAVNSSDAVVVVDRPAG
ncbi:hypothetical protein [Modestobacter marinus]|uniref:hypothetical protein n=1 Tax=Modestobacter marinus TaxID=477641 RepID=UPI001C96E9E3|nr:hypothetical protein [Modestobacter marinus]